MYSEKLEQIEKMISIERRKKGKMCLLPEVAAGMKEICPPQITSKSKTVPINPVSWVLSILLQINVTAIYNYVIAWYLVKNMFINCQKSIVIREKTECKWRCEFLIFYILIVISSVIVLFLNETQCKHSKT